MKLGKKNSVIDILMVCLDYTYFFNKQLALGWQIDKQVSGPNLFFTKQQIKATD